VWANDIDEDAVATYKKNLGEHIVLGDIKKIDTETIPDADVVIGGFPCQGFSQANLSRSKNDERNFLYLEFLRVVKDKQPKYFIAENVRGILSLDGGKAIKRILASFSNAGYAVEYRLLDFADYGVPQRRRRVMIAGTRNDLPSDRKFVFPEPTHTGRQGKDANGSLKPWVSVYQALNSIPESKEGHGELPNQAYSKYKVNERNFTGHRKTYPDRPCPTILARGNGKGGVCAIPHPSGQRRMSVRESATIQTFPLNYEFVGNLGSTYRQVGNAVPVLFGRCLGLQLSILNKG
jgi:DNA (cytosine-5)-methyltransferase 1